MALGAAIVALAFGVGYGGRALLSGDDASDSSEITVEQAHGVPLGISRAELLDRLDGKSPTVTQPVPGDGTCLFYALTGRPDTAWEFCFVSGKLTSTQSATGK